jgi:hypothetical protein
VIAGGGEGHWLDRLAVAHTRRHSFKAALAAAAVAGPLARVARAWADNPNSSDPHACQKGCLYASFRETNAAFDGCDRIRGISQRSGAMFFLMGNGLAGVLSVTACLDYARCRNNATLEAKARAYDCLQNTCPGFDPAGEWGPCRNCASINGCQCCPDASSSTGYTYCSSLSNQCCNPGGGCRNCGP